MKNLEFAKRFAAMMHYGQTYGKSDQPHTYHLERVEKILARFGFTDEEWGIYAWLHDIIEDVHGVNYVNIRAGFGKEIADVIFSVTNAVGRNRAEKFKYTYPKISENRSALVVKLADRIANIENGLENRTSYVQMYKKEWPDFKKALLDKRETDVRVLKMWSHLENLFEGSNE